MGYRQNTQQRQGFIHELQTKSIKMIVQTVSRGARIGHFFIDLFIIEFISNFIRLIPNSEVTGLLELVLFPAYYLIFEYYYQWTPGKLITDTIVVDSSGNKPNIQSIILRTFIRLIPFEPFSCLGSERRGWHDRWSNTYVVSRESVFALKKQLDTSTDRESEVNDRPNYAIAKVLLIVSILAAIAVTGYFAAQKMKELMNFNFEKVISDMTETEYTMIQGEWESNWNIYPTLKFVDHQALVATNQQGDTLNLTYAINPGILMIKDEKGLNLQFLILGLTKDSLTLRDIRLMKDNIEFLKK